MYKLFIQLLANPDANELALKVSKTSRQLLVGSHVKKTSFNAHNGCKYISPLCGCNELFLFRALFVALSLFIFKVRFLFLFNICLRCAQCAIYYTIRLGLVVYFYGIFKNSSG